ncbi:MAG: hypothetical protein AB1458_14570 [Bacteroidota bacterium]
MKRNILLLVLSFVLAANARAQLFQTSRHTFIEHEQGLFFPDFRNMNDYIFTYDNMSFGDSLRTWGIAVHSQTDQFLFMKTQVDADFSVRSFIPHLISRNDSLSYRISGWMISYSKGRDVFSNSNFLDLILNVGYDFGRFKMYYTDLYRPERVSKGKYTNPSFMLHGHADLRFNFLKKEGSVGITLGLKGLYTYDISNGKWKAKKDQLPGLSFQTKMTGYMLLATLGLAFHSSDDEGSDEGGFKLNDRMPDR